MELFFYGGILEFDVEWNCCWLCVLFCIEVIEIIEGWVRIGCYMVMDFLMEEF